MDRRPEDVTLRWEALSPSERERLLRMLRETPWVAQPAERWTTGMTGAVIGACLAASVAWRGVPGIAPSDPMAWLANGTALGLAVGLGLYLVGAVIRARGIAAAPYRCGRFLHAFGYVEAHPSHVTIWPGRSIVDVAVAGIPARAGDVHVTVTTGHAKRTLRFHGLDLDVPVDGLSAMLRARWDEPDAYRGARAPFAPQPRSRGIALLPWLPELSGAIVGVAVAVVASQWLMPAMTIRDAGARLEWLARLERTSWPPWVASAAHRAVMDRCDSVDRSIALRFTSPWAEALSTIVARRRSGEQVWVRADEGACTWSIERGSEIDAWAEAHAPADVVQRDLEALPFGTARPVRAASLALYVPASEPAGWHVEVRDVLRDVVSHWGEWRSREASPTARLETSCRLTPVSGARIDDRAFAQIETEVTVTLEVRGGPMVRRVIHVPVPSDEIFDVPPWQSPYAVWERQVRERVEAELRRDMLRAPTVATVSVR